MTERDPKINPIPGDVLQKKLHGVIAKTLGFREREVDDVDGGMITYVGPDVCAPCIALASWRKWAKTATVIKRGDA